MSTRPGTGEDDEADDVAMMRHTVDMIRWEETKQRRKVVDAMRILTNWSVLHLAGAHHPSAKKRLFVSNLVLLFFGQSSL